MSPATDPGPTLRIERMQWKAGETLVCGIDEVGRGAWAGPVTVGAVVAPPHHLRGVRDSKQLTRDERERASTRVMRWALGFAVGHASAQECDELGMTAAQRLAGTRALDALEAQGLVPDKIILDGKHDYLALGERVTTVVRGDQACLSVAAASCIAKVTRDRLMREEAEHFPHYGFESNVGYPAPDHQRALAAVWSERHPSPFVGVHGEPVLGRSARGAGPPVRVASRATKGAAMDVDVAEVHAAALDRTRAWVAGVGTNDWQRPSTCPAWTVRELVNHVVSGNWWAAELGAGATIEGVGDRLDGDVLGDDPLAAYDASAAAAAAVFRAPGALDAPCAVSYGPVPGSVYCGHRFMDVLVHGWDVAKSTAQDTTIAPELVEALWAVVAPQRDMLVGSGAFAVVEIPDAADRQTELLALLGRVA